MKRKVIFTSSIIINVLLITILVVQYLVNNFNKIEQASNKNVLVNSADTIKNLKRTDPDEDGYVPNKEAAIKIVEAIWLPIYGESIYKCRPFKADLINNVWYVYGTFNPVNERSKGGVPLAEIQKKDCKVLKVTHEK